MTAVREGGRATLTVHSAVMGDTSKTVRKFTVGPVGPWAQYPRTVRIEYVEPRRRLARGYRVTPGDETYVIIEAGAAIVYDSRDDVPCDMTRWQATRDRFAENRVAGILPSRPRADEVDR